MKQKELTKTFMIISNKKKPVGLHGLCKNMSALQGFNVEGHKFILNIPRYTMPKDNQQSF